jgi:hypothetical protein
MKAGSVHTLLMSGVNPVYTLAVSVICCWIEKVTTSVVMSLKEDETALLDEGRTKTHTKTPTTFLSMVGR